jgi:GNAT superfamily N-acetyltransferase
LADEAHVRFHAMRARIVRLRPGEGDRWRRIRLTALQEAPYAFGTKYAEASQWTAARWEAQVVEVATFVAVLDGRDVGVARGASHHRGDARELVGMWVDPSARRVGIAAQLIESVAAWATAAGATVLVLDVVEGNAAAIALYGRTGFVPVDGDTMGECAAGEIRFVRSLATVLGR